MTSTPTWVLEILENVVNFVAVTAAGGLLWIGIRRPYRKVRDRTRLRRERYAVYCGLSDLLRDAHYHERPEAIREFRRGLRRWWHDAESVTQFRNRTLSMYQRIEGIVEHDLLVETSTDEQVRDRIGAWDALTSAAYKLESLLAKERQPTEGPTVDRDADAALSGDDSPGAS